MVKSARYSLEFGVGSQGDLYSGQARFLAVHYIRKCKRTGHDEGRRCRRG